MADEATVTVDPAKMARLVKAIEETETVLGRDASDAVSYAAVMIARSAAAFAKPGKRMREVRPDARFKGLWQFDVLLQPPKSGETITTWNKNDPRRKINAYGLSRDVWRSLGGTAAEMRGRNGVRKGGVRYGKKKKDFQTYSFFSNPDVTEAKMIVALSYQEKAYPGITAHAVDKGAGALNYRINKALGVIVDRANRP